MADNLSLTRSFFDALEVLPSATGDVHRHTLRGTEASARPVRCAHLMRRWDATYRVPGGWLRVTVFWAYCRVTRSLFHTEGKVDKQMRYANAR